MESADQSEPQHPFLSVITVTKDHAEGLANTLTSVREQNFADLEVIVVDGHSTDNTAAVVDRFSDIVKKFERDEGGGVYPAMNQATRLATGEWLIYMNAGDCFATQDVVKKFKTVCSGDVVFGQAITEAGNPHLDPIPIEDAWRRMPFSHQAAFIRASRLDSAGGYDESFRICADYDLFLKLGAQGASFVEFPECVARIEWGGISVRGHKRLMWESFVAARRYYPLSKVFPFYFQQFRNHQGNSFHQWRETALWPRYHRLLDRLPQAIRNPMRRVWRKFH